MQVYIQGVDARLLSKVVLAVREGVRVAARVGSVHKLLDGQVLLAPAGDSCRIRGSSQASEAGCTRQAGGQRRLVPGVEVWRVAMGELQWSELQRV